MRNESDCLWEEIAQRPVADDDERQAGRCLDELPNTLLLREPPHVEDVRWLVGQADILRNVDAARDHAHLARAERSRVGRERIRGTDDDPRAPQNRPKQPRQPLCELDVAPPQLHDERLARRETRESRREPVGVHHVGVTSRTAGGTRKREQEQRQQEHSPLLGAEVVGDPVAVRDPEMAERIRGDDAHLDAFLAQMLDGVSDEAPGEITRLARIRRRQDADFHGAESRRPNTAGATIASIAKTKK